MKIRRLSFQCPINRVPCIAKYYVEVKVLAFEVKNNRAEISYTLDELDETSEWCVQHFVHCESTEYANKHLASLGIYESFDDESLKDIL